MNEEIDNKVGMGNSLNNIGWAYKNKGDYDNALDYFCRSLAIDDDFGDKRGMGLSRGNIGNAYYLKGDYEKAEEFLEKSLSIEKELGELIELATTPLLYLIYKHLDKEYDENIIRRLIKDENIEFELNYRLYELLEDKS